VTSPITIMSLLKKCFGKDDCTDEEFLEKKWKRFFTMIDGDKDGFVTRKDHEEMGERFVKKAPGDKKQKDDIRDYFNAIWNKVYDVNKTRDKINVEEFLKVYHAMGTPTMTVIAKDVAMHLFKAVVGDEKGLTLEEFKNLLERFCNDRKVAWAAGAFKLADTNKDGKLSLEGFQKAFVGFLTDTDRKSPYNGLFGPFD